MSSNSKSTSKAVQVESKIPGKCQYVIWKSDFIVDQRYQPIKGIGKGAYGIVCSAKDTVSGKKVAIKKITNAFENPVDTKRTLREMRLLRSLKHENIVQLLDILPPPAMKSQFNDIYLIYELMDTDMHQIIRSSQDLTDDHFQYFISQVLSGLKFIHCANVLHRDLKPSNLLLTANCDLKICDFGLARQSDEQNFMTEYVVTRWYRAPELLLSCDKYTEAIDVWAVGCILAELLLRKPIFPGKNYLNQLQRIVEHLGMPRDEDLRFITNSKAHEYIKNLKLPAKKPGQNRAIFPPGCNPDALDLLERMLQFNPHQRITVEQALAHPYLQKVAPPGEESTNPGVFDLGYDEDNLTEDQLRQLVLEEISHYHPN